MRFLQYLNRCIDGFIVNGYLKETGNTKLSIQWERVQTGWRTEFELSGVFYRMVIQEKSYGCITDFMTNNGYGYQYRLTHTHSTPFQLISVIVNGFFDKCSGYDNIVFIADNDDPSRIKLYNRVIKKYYKYSYVSKQPLYTLYIVSNKTDISPLTIAKVNSSMIISKIRALK